MTARMITAQIKRASEKLKYTVRGFVFRQDAHHSLLSGENNILTLYGVGKGILENARLTSAFSLIFTIYHIVSRIRFRYQS